MSGAMTLPDDILAWIEKVTGQPVAKADRIPGGGIRQGWFIDVGPPDGPIQPLFLRYSPAPLPEPTAFHRLATEAEVVKALGQAGIAVAHVHAVHPDREAVLLERVSGQTWFRLIKDPDEQVSVAQDFISNLASIHRLDPASLDAPSLGPVKTAREHALERISEIRFRATASDGSIDPLVQLSADWLERNVPDYEGPVVLVQGDTGPGNFLYEDGRVTAVLDWELCHWGDPMDDIAWLSLRTVQDTFTHLPDRLREYEQLSGHPIDIHRVWYYRLFAETSMATLNGHPEESSADGVTRDLGNAMLYTQLHRRLWLETLNYLMDLNLRPPTIPDPPPTEEWHDVYDDVLGTIKAVVPRIDDPLASQWVKGAARLIRFLSETDIVGRQFAALELDELSSLLGAVPASLATGRSAAALAHHEGRIQDSVYTRYLWNCVMRDDHLRRHASGALATRTWPPLV
jgi:aminoglycoside phosphotransferase (APT) family kinase protein